MIIGNHLNIQRFHLYDAKERQESTADTLSMAACSKV